MSDMRLPQPQPRNEFRTRLRADLVNEAVALAEERRLRRSPWERLVSSMTLGRLRPIAVVATLAAVLLAGTGAAAASSMPGDPAFAIKRAAEEVELALAPDDDARVRVLDTQAGRRLDELGRTADRPEKAPTASAEYEAAVARFAAAVERVRAAQPGSKREAVEQLVDAARDKHVKVLEELKDRLPAPAQKGIERAIEEHRKMAPSAKPAERPHETERPRATETPRGGRPTPTPTRRP